jgi:hypothetical protein
MYGTLAKATAFFMSFMVFMVKNVSDAGRRPGCTLFVS